MILPRCDRAGLAAKSFRASDGTTRPDRCVTKGDGHAPMRYVCPRAHLAAPNRAPDAHRQQDGKLKVYDEGEGDGRGGHATSPCGLYPLGDCAAAVLRASLDSACLARLIAAMASARAGRLQWGTSFLVYQ